MKKFQSILVSLALVWSSLGYAADPKKERAKEIFVSAKEHYDKKEYEEALAGFEELLRVTENGAVHLNIAQCQRLLGRYEEAVASYRRFLDENPKTPYREQIEEKVSEMESSLAKAKEEARLKELEATSKPVIVDATFSSATQPVIEPTSTWVLPPDAMRSLEEQMKSLESTTQGSIELALKRSSRFRFALPGGLALAGGALGVGAIALHAGIEASGETTRKAQRTLSALAIGSDVSFIAAGATFFYVVRKNASEEQYYVGIAPAKEGGILSIGFVR